MHDSPAHGDKDIWQVLKKIGLEPVDY